jgi:hypothetical protein
MIQKDMTLSNLEEEKYERNANQINKKSLDILESPESDIENTTPLLKKYLSKDVDECKKSSSTKIKVRR